tara:strand:+ start:945 stop:1223 length:279 start_codon:yes stop_codon:yes gene_type:complete
MEDNFNKHIGKKLRFRRLELGLNQTKVGEALGFSFQQIQKYEKGTNAVSSLGLLRLANFFKVPITYFYEGYSEYQIPKEPIVITVKETVNEV